MVSILGHYFWRMLWGVDILANVLTGGKRETISARLGRHKDKVLIGPICDVLSKIDPYSEDHCGDSLEWWDQKW